MVSGETSQLQGRMKPYCWTEWIQANVASLIPMISNMMPSDLKQRDTQFRWTMVHALCSSDLPANVCESILACLKEKCLISQIAAKDAEGDTPLSSAIRSRVKSEIIELLLQQVPSYTKVMLETRNEKHETPLDRALDMRQWKIVRMLLKRCIENSLLPELTGISPDAMKSETLLHRAFQCGKVKYLQIFLEVCRECEVEPQQVHRALVMQTEGGCTPWYYLMNHTCLKTMEKTIEILRLFEIDINSLYIDSKTQKSSLLHEAVRRNHKPFIELLLRSGANPHLKDARGLTPFDRKRRVESESLTDGGSTLAVVHSVKCMKKKRRRRKRRKHRSIPRVVDTAVGVGELSHTGTKRKRRKRHRNQKEERVVGVGIPADHDYGQNHLQHTVVEVGDLYSLPNKERRNKRRKRRKNRRVVHTPVGVSDLSRTGVKKQRRKRPKNQRLKEKVVDVDTQPQQHTVFEAPNTLQIGRAEQPASPVPNDDQETTSEEHALSPLVTPDSASRPGQHTVSPSSTQPTPPEEATIPEVTCIVNGNPVIPSLDLLAVGDGINHFDFHSDHAPIWHSDHSIIFLVGNCGPSGVT